ncbi:MAG: hypothetical protein KY445_16685, partial [Armatimonadetes bacterium]|nr:hypothetical protein [Armatimonadota bacterium]
MNLSNSFLPSLALSLALCSISGAQDTPPVGAPAPGNTPVESGPATDGTQGAAGGSPQILVPVPNVGDAGLADARHREALDAPVLTLEGAVANALQNNPTPQAARAALNAALARV